MFLVDVCQGSALVTETEYSSESFISAHESTRRQGLSLPTVQRQLFKADLILSNWDIIF